MWLCPSLPRCAVSGNVSGGSRSATWEDSPHRNWQRLHILPFLSPPGEPVVKHLPASTPLLTISANGHGSRLGEWDEGSGFLLLDRAYAKCRHSTEKFSKIPDLNFTSFVKENSSLYHVRWVSLTKSWDCRAMWGEQHAGSSVEEGALPTEQIP